MCGRFTLTAGPGVLRDFFKIDISTEHMPRYNIAPGQDTAVIAMKRQGRRELFNMRWGLVPHWAGGGKPGIKMINARAETIDQKPAFKGSFLNRRCLVPADGFYEWQKYDGKKRPVRVFLPGQAVFAFAGIWECKLLEGDQALYSFSIITTAANEFISGIHDRMPVILSSQRECAAWLEPAGSTAGAVVLKELLQPYRGEMLAHYVSTLVNSPRNDHVALLEKTGEYQPARPAAASGPQS